MSPWETRHFHPLFPLLFFFADSPSSHSRSITRDPSRISIRIDPLLTPSETILLSNRNLYTLHLPLLAQTPVVPYCRLDLLPEIGKTEILDRTDSDDRRVDVLVAGE